MQQEKKFLSKKDQRKKQNCNFCYKNFLLSFFYRFLHLHRKTKGHQRQVFKEEEDAIKVDLHEGCGRTKLFWLLALADSLTLKVIYLKDIDNKTVKKIGI